MAAVVAVAVLLVLWLWGALFAYISVMMGGYNPEYMVGTRGMISRVVWVAALTYLMGSWVFWLGGLFLLPLGWLSQLLAFWSPAMHWMSRACHATSVLLFTAPFGLLALDLGLAWIVANGFE